MWGRGIDYEAQKAKTKLLMTTMLMDAPLLDPSRSTLRFPASAQVLGSVHTLQHQLLHPRGLRLEHLGFSCCFLLKVQTGTPISPAVGATLQRQIGALRLFLAGCRLQSLHRAAEPGLNSLFIVLAPSLSTERLAKSRATLAAPEATSGGTSLETLPPASSRCSWDAETSHPKATAKDDKKETGRGKEWVALRRH